MADETVDPDRVAELEQQVAELAAQIDEQKGGDTPTSTRRQVLGSMAAGGVLGGLAGAGSAGAATDTEDTSASLAQVDPGVFKIADPGLYRGPDSGKSSVSDNTQHEFRADDTGRQYYNTGSGWTEFPRGQGRTKHVSSGGDLADEVNGMLGEFSTLHVSEPTGTNDWTWDQDLTINPTSYDGGVHIEFDDGVKVDYTGSGWPLVVDSGGGGVTDPQADGKNFGLRGGIWGFGNATPSGFIELIDMLDSHVIPEAVAESFTGTAIKLTVDSTNCERNIIGGVIRESTIGVDLNGSSLDSFADCKFPHLSVGANDAGVVLRALNRGVHFSHYNFFPRADGAVAIRCDGTRNDGCTFSAPRFDNVDNVSGPYVVETTANYSNAGPMINDWSWSGAAEWNEANYANSAHRVWGRRAFGDDVRFHPFGSHGTTKMAQDGGLTVEDSSGNDQTRIAASGPITNEQGNPVPFNSQALFNSGWKVGQQNSGGIFVGNNQWTIYVSDGTDGNAQGDVVVKVDVGGTTQTEVISQRSNQT